MPLEPCARCHRNLHRCRCLEGWQSEVSKDLEDTLIRWKREKAWNDKWIPPIIMGGGMGLMTLIVVAAAVFG